MRICSSLHLKCIKKLIVLIGWLLIFTLFVIKFKMLFFAMCCLRIKWRMLSSNHFRTRFFLSQNSELFTPYLTLHMVVFGLFYLNGPSKYHLNMCLHGGCNRKHSIQMLFEFCFKMVKSSLSKFYFHFGISSIVFYSKKFHNHVMCSFSFSLFVYMSFHRI